MIDLLQCCAYTGVWRLPFENAFWESKYLDIHPCYLAMHIISFIPVRSDTGEKHSSSWSTSSFSYTTKFALCLPTFLNWSFFLSYTDFECNTFWGAIFSASSPHFSFSNISTYVLWLIAIFWLVTFKGALNLLFDFVSSSLQCVNCVTQ